MSSDVNRFCGKCGATLVPGDPYCGKCGAPVSSAQPLTRTSSSGPGSQELDWREQRRQMRAQRRAERYGSAGRGFGGLIIATILIIAGLAIFFPTLPWQAFWGSILIILGSWFVYLWVLRGRRYSQPQQQPQ